MNRESKQHKVLFVGPVGAGKTTAVAVLSDNNCINTDVRVSDMARFRKPETTAALDYGVTTIRECNMKVHLYGAPGQQRFDFMWDVLHRGLTGLAILIDHSRRTPLEDLAFYLDWFRTMPQRPRLAVGINFHNGCPAAAFVGYEALLRQRGIESPVLPIDARNHDSMRRFILTLV